MPNVPAIPDQPDFTRASHARVQNYLSGGKDHYPADRAAADTMIAAMAVLPGMVRESHRFRARAVRHLIADLGVRQLLDLDGGLPTTRDAHDVAQDADPAARIVYLADDLMVLAHRRALTRTHTTEGRVTVLHGDLGQPKLILDDPQLRDTLDGDQPIALLLVSTLERLADDDAHHLVATLVAALPPGSCVAICHGCSSPAGKR